MSVLLVKLPILFLLGEMGNADTCSKLAPLYNSLQCSSYCRRGQINTKYDCTKSDIMVNVKMGECYFNGIHYKNGDFLPQTYPNKQNTELCKYKCDAPISDDTVPGTFNYDDLDCAAGTIGTSTCPCVYDSLRNQDSFFKYAAPVFIGNDICPAYWQTSSNFDSSDDCSSNPKFCCRFRDKYIKLQRSIMLAPAVECTCTCPPLLQCKVV
ncbi:hypothetical protein FQA39_LY10782 [Lamprigera yunnana]|nr:hypothetical protein FQA39_LY10782 [Lamprigera yunnana]